MLKRTKAEEKIRADITDPLWNSIPTFLGWGFPMDIFVFVARMQRECVEGMWEVLNLRKEDFPHHGRFVPVSHFNVR